MGAWIETKGNLKGDFKENVAPHVGAWIETNEKELKVEEVFESHPMWVRGLKHILTLINMKNLWSHPMWVRGLKHGAYIGDSYSTSRTPCGCVD